jgi:hypothetical protein
MTSFLRIPYMKPFFISLISATILAAENPLSFILESRTATNKLFTVSEQWLPSRTAIIVCDMWDLHHCKNAVTREKEMAPRMNKVIEKARAAGVLIIHAPSSCMMPYEGSPARIRAKSAPTALNLPNSIGEWCKQIPTEELAVYPLDQSDGGEDDDPAEHAAWAKELEAKGLNPRAPWSKQIDTLRIDQRQRRGNLEPSRIQRHRQRYSDGRAFEYVRERPPLWPASDGKERKARRTYA